MKYFRNLLLLVFLLASQFSVSSGHRETRSIATADYNNPESLNSATIYFTLNLNNQGLSFKAFDLAVKGMKRLYAEGRLTRTDIISIADLSQSSCKKRLYIIDLVKQQVLFQTYVAHGRNSGEEYANSFSNEPSSYKTSLGFYTTLDSYIGDHGLSLHLKGEEPGINDRAFDRAIVLHGAPYVSSQFIHDTGRLGRSQGCPAVPADQCSSIVNSISGGSCLFIYYPDSHYEHNSRVINS